MSATNILTLCLGMMLMHSEASAQSAWEWQNPLPQGNDLTKIQVLSSTTGFTCGDHGTILRTTTSGVTWSQLSLPTRINFSELRFVNSSIGWSVGTQHDSVFLYSTTNAGDSWSVSFTAQGAKISLSFSDSVSGWLAVDSVVYRTTDGGATWLPLATLGVIEQIHFLNDSIGWAISGSSVYRTSDTGNNWLQATIPPPPGFYAPFLQEIRFVNDSVGWVAGYTWETHSLLRRLYKSSDGGTTWNEQIVGNPFPVELFTDIEFRNESLGWTLVRGQLFHTSNGGQTWMLISEQQYLESISSVSDSILWGAGFFGFLGTSSDGGISWTSANGSSIGSSSIEGRADLFVFDVRRAAGVTGHSLFRTADSGATWQKTDLPTFGHSFFAAQAICFIDTLNGWIGCSYGGLGALLRTTDGGDSWSIQIDSIYRVFTIHFANPMLGWFASRRTIYRTTDGGNTWAPQSSHANMEEFLSVFFTNPDSGWAGGYLELLRTTNSGLTWDVVRPGGDYLYVQDIHFLNSQQGWVIGQRGPANMVCKTADGGATWAVLQLPVQPYARVGSIFMTDSDDGWICGSNPTPYGGFVLKSMNGGTDWVQIDFPTNQSLNRIRFADQNNGWVFGNRGVILHTSMGGTVSVIEETTSPAVYNFALLQNYPNPFNPVTNIQFLIVNRQLTILKVYDVLGREVATLVNEWLAPGNHERAFDASGLSSGVYFYRLTAGDFTQTRKLILMK